MFDQLSFFDNAPPPAPPPAPPAPAPARPDGVPGAPHTVFFALFSTAYGADSLHSKAATSILQLCVGGQPLEAARLHVSLHAVGVYFDERPEADIARWCRAAAAVRCAPFEVVFDRVATFGGDGNPFVFKSSQDEGIAGVLTLYQSLGIELANAGESIKRHRITPHMTLAYRGKRIAETPIEPVRWRAHELVLIDSHVGAHRHDVLGRWPLVG